jgi:hypothetical protein
VEIERKSKSRDNVMNFVHCRSLGVFNSEIPILAGSTSDIDDETLRHCCCNLRLRNQPFQTVDVRGAESSPVGKNTGDGASRPSEAGAEFE